ncbi:sporulation protein [Kitasatospora sp. NPDC059646]|uniref:sporulation protein n=1 Tax=Kitasatospora sp. NPDC059646 TaxID=3346893 RepID=UPI003689D7DA
MAERGKAGHPPEVELTEPPEVELRLDDPELTDRWIAGTVVIRAGRQALEQVDLGVELVVDAHSHRGKHLELVICNLAVDDYCFELAAGEEHQVRFRRELPWECPFTEYDGQGLGFGVGVRAVLRTVPARKGGIRHRIPLRVPPTAAPAAAVAAFGALGRTERSARVIDERIPGSGQLYQGHQSVFLTDPAGERQGYGHLELSFVTNEVGALVHLRRAAPGKYKWKSRPPTVTFPVAHHEVGYADLTARAAAALEELRLLERA